MQSLKNLKDIRGYENIPDISFYLFLGLCVLALLIVVSLIAYIFGIFKQKKKSKRKQYIQRLKNIDFKEQKRAAYLITKYGRKVADTKECKEIFEHLEEKLQKYKYKKETPKFDDETKREYQMFLEVCCG